MTPIPPPPRRALIGFALGVIALALVSPRPAQACGGGPIEVQSATIEAVFEHFDPASWRIVVRDASGRDRSLPLSTTTLPTRAGARISWRALVPGTRLTLAITDIGGEVAVERAIVHESASSSREASSLKSRGVRSCEPHHARKGSPRCRAGSPR